LIRQKIHMWELDKFPHQEISPQISLAYSIFNEYTSAREFGQRKAKQNEMWGNQKTPQEVIDQFKDL